MLTFLDILICSVFSCVSMQYTSIDNKMFYMFTFSNIQLFREDAYICSDESSPMKEKKQFQRTVYIQPFFTLSVNHCGN